jgi:hypothetical protein
MRTSVIIIISYTVITPPEGYTKDQEAASTEAVKDEYNMFNEDAEVCGNGVTVVLQWN